MQSKVSGPIVVLDDEPDIREYLRLLLWEEGYPVNPVESVDEALVQIEKGNVSLVISDIRLPGRTGIDLLKEIKVRWPAMPVILITGFADISTKEALELGAADIIRKPFDFERLLAAVEKCLKK